jgi:hypothetical protein
MDAPNKIFLILFFSFIGAIILVGAYFPRYEPPPIISSGIYLEIYQDELLKIQTPNDIIFNNIEQQEIVYQKTIWVLNPSNTTLRVVVYWEMFPTEMKNFVSTGWELDTDIIQPEEIKKVVLRISVHDIAIMPQNLEVYAHIEGAIYE